MGDITDCVGLYGHSVLVETRPSLLNYRECLYIPCHLAGYDAGLYDVGRRLIVPSAYFHGPAVAAPSNFECKFPSEKVGLRGNDPVVYGGFLHGHFGHFLLSTFSRLWPYVLGPRPDLDVPILVHTAEPGAAQFFSARPWATEMIGAIGLKPQNFLTCYEPTRFSEILVPAPSFEELSFVHRAFANLCNAAGQKLAFEQPIGSRRPAYISKEKLGSGVRKVVNEHEVTSILAKHGVDIVHPESSSLSQQAAFWRDRPVVAGIVSSGLHASVFAPGRKTIAVSDSSVILSNFHMIDRVNGARGRYLGLPPDSLVKQPLTAEFSELTVLNDPPAVATAILEAIG